MEGKPGLNPRVHPPHLRMDLVLIQHVARPGAPDDACTPVFKRRTRLQRAESAHQTAPDAFLLSHPPGQLILVHRGRPQKYHRQSVFLKRMQCRFLQPLARPLYVLRVVLEQDPVNAEVLLHPCGHQGLQLRVPAALVSFLNEPRNTRRSNPVRVPVIWSAYFSINYCMGVLLCRWNWSFNDTITQRGTPLPAHHSFAAKPRCATYAIRSLAKSHSTTRRSCAERLIMCAQAAAW